MENNKKEEYWVNEEIESGAIHHYSISGKVGIREYYRMGKFTSREEVERQVTVLREGKAFIQQLG